MVNQAKGKELPSRVILRISFFRFFIIWVMAISIYWSSLDTIQDPWHLFSPGVGKAIGYIALCFFGICSFIFPLLLFPQSSYLELNADGFNRRAAYRNNFQNWTDVSRFEVSKYCGRNFVFYNVYERKMSSFAKWKFLLRFNRARLCGFDLMIPPWLYGMEAQTLASLLNLYRD
jgi:hypothetical protein